MLPSPPLSFRNSLLQKINSELNKNKKELEKVMRKFQDQKIQPIYDQKEFKTARKNIIFETWEQDTQRKRQRIQTPKTLQCPICAETMQRHEIARFGYYCSHFSCSKCLQQHIRQQLKDFKVIPCLDQKCTQTVNEDSKIYRQIMSVQQKEKYYKILIYAQVNRSSNKKLCPKEDCLGFMLTDQKPFCCIVCSQQFCQKCLYSKHKGPCDKNDIKFMEKDLQYKQCDNCKIVVQRIDGCDHMTCRCGHQFCYLCGEVWQDNHQCDSDQSSIPSLDQSQTNDNLPQFEAQHYSFPEQELQKKPISTYVPTPVYQHSYYEKEREYEKPIVTQMVQREIPIQYQILENCVKIESNETLPIFQREWERNERREQKFQKMNEEASQKIKTCFEILYKIVVRNNLSLWKLFVDFDNKKGSLNMQQFSRLLKTFCGPIMQISDDQIRWGFRMIDQDGSDSIQYQKLYKYYSKINSSPDSNNTLFFQEKMKPETRLLRNESRILSRNASRDLSIHSSRNSSIERIKISFSYGKPKTHINNYETSHNLISLRNPNYPPPKQSFTSRVDLVQEKTRLGVNFNPNNLLNRRM